MLQRVPRGFGSGRRERVTTIGFLRLLKVSLPAWLDGLLYRQVRSLLFGAWPTVPGGSRLLWRNRRGTHRKAITLCRRRTLVIPVFSGFGHGLELFRGGGD
jgi:hypothetical protein